MREHGIAAIKFFGPELPTTKLGSIQLFTYEQVGALFDTTLTPKGIDPAVERAAELETVVARVVRKGRLVSVSMTGEPIESTIKSLGDLAREPMEAAGAPLHAQVALRGLAKLFKTIGNITLPTDTVSAAWMMAHDAYRRAAYIACGINLPKMNQ